MSQPSVAIAFGGGGARGLAHIHVIAALEELGITPVAISGASIGSIMGAGLASGMRASDIQDYVVGTFSEPTKVLSKFWKMRPGSVSEVFSGPRTMLGNIDPIKVMDAFLADAIPDKFEDLQLPFQVVATDFYDQRSVTLDKGNLKEALAASSALPAIFRPVQKDGAVLVDGGILNSVPYELLFGKADIVVAVDVIGGPMKSKKPIPTRIEALAGASQLMMYATTALKLKMMPPTVYIEPPVKGIAVLDFFKAKQIIEDTANTKEQTKHALDAAIQNEV